MAQLWAPQWLHLMLIYVWEHFKKNCSNRLLKDRFLGTYLYKMWIWSGLRMMKNYRAFFHVPITYIPLSSSLMKYITLPFPSSTPLVLYRKVNNPQIYTPNLPTPINTFCLAAVILLMWLRTYHTVKLLISGEFAPTTNLWKNDWVNLKIIWKEGDINEGDINKVVWRKV
jgi:hypothetical protein